MRWYDQVGIDFRVGILQPQCDLVITLPPDTAHTRAHARTHTVCEPQTRDIIIFDSVSMQSAKQWSSCFLSSKRVSRTFCSSFFSSIACSSLVSTTKARSTAGSTSVLYVLLIWSMHVVCTGASTQLYSVIASSTLVYMTMMAITIKIIPSSPTRIVFCHTKPPRTRQPQNKTSQ